MNNSEFHGRFLSSTCIALHVRCATSRGATSFKVPPKTHEASMAGRIYHNNSCFVNTIHQLLTQLAVVQLQRHKVMRSHAATAFLPLHQIPSCGTIPLITPHYTCNTLLREIFWVYWLCLDSPFTIACTALAGVTLRSQSPVASNEQTR